MQQIKFVQEKLQIGIMESTIYNSTRRIWESYK